LMLALPFFFAAFVVVISLPGTTPGDASIPTQHIPAPVRNLSRGDARFYAIQFLLGVALAGQLWSYLLINPGSAFQSPYCTSAPAHLELLISYLQQKHIHYVWATNWIAYPLVFKTKGAVIAADPRPIIRHWDDLNRIPANTEAVIHADRPSMISLVSRDDHYPILLRLLETEHITYRVARFASQPTTDMLVVTPLNRSIIPFEPETFYYAFVCNEPRITTSLSPLYSSSPQPPPAS
jgi:hypothetical protein